MTQTSVLSATTAERRAILPEIALRVSARGKSSAVTVRRKVILLATALRVERRERSSATTATRLDTLPVNAPSKSSIDIYQGIYLHSSY